MPRVLKFLHVSTFYPPYSFGGDAVYAYRLAHALADAGHHVDVIHSIDSYHLYHPADPPEGFSDHPGVTRYGLRSSAGALSSLIAHQTGWPLMIQQQIQTIFDSQPYDVIHYHNISLLGPGVLTLQARQAPAVKVYSTHDHWLICPLHVLWKFGERVCEKPACIRCMLAAKRPPQLWRYSDLLSRAVNDVDAIVAPSQFTVRLHAERGFSRPIAHLPYFMDRVDRDWKQPAPRPHPRPYFLFVGRLETIKGLHTLIDAWRHAPDVDLLVAGTGSEESELRARAAADPRIKFLGQLTQEQLGVLYVHALACVVPSLTYETFGMVTIEAFARKTPIIARDLGPLSEIVQTSGGGLLYQTDEQLLDALRRLAARPALARELGEAGYCAFARYWSREAHLERYFELLREAALNKFGCVPWHSSLEAAPEPVEQR
jgi:glycosyltransferase involved in cell wall biosynthesis